MNQEQEKLDIFALLRGLPRALRVLLIPGLAVCALLAGLLCLRAYSSHVPMYRAGITFTVQTTNPLYANQQYYNAATAEQMAKTFPYILTSSALRTQVQQALGIGYVPAVSASVLGSTNLFTLSCTAADPELANDVVQCMMELYPQVAEFVVGPTVLTRIDETGVPTAPINPLSLGRTAVKGLLLGLALWVAAALLYWLTHRTLGSEQELRALVNLPCLGSVPRVPGAGRNGVCPMLSNRADKFGFSESIRLLRIRLERAMEKEQAQVLLVTSTIANEGKTTLSVNLANALAQKGKRVLLADCDLRNPSVAINYGQAQMPGLTEYLQEQCRLDDILYHTDNPNLYALFAGKPAAQPERLLRTGEAADLLLSARKTFDYIILDATPCALLADAADLCTLADCVLMAVRQDFACRSQVLEGMRLLGDCGRPVLGTVLTMVPQRGRLSSYLGYGYGYSSYGYGYGYGYRRKSTESNDPRKE